MIDVAKIVQGPSLTDPVLVLPTDLQVSFAADDRLLELAHHLQGVAEIPRSLGLPQPVPHGPGQGQVVLVVLHRLEEKEAHSDLGGHLNHKTWRCVKFSRKRNQHFLRWQKPIYPIEPI